MNEGMRKEEDSLLFKRMDAFAFAETSRQGKRIQ
jgi:hypothetical protein